jgi:ATP-dependent Clp protease protease subunit
MNPLAYRSERNAQAVAAFWGKSLEKPDWYEIKALAGDATEIFIYSVIGWPFTDVSGLIRAMAAEKDKAIIARINSPGGDVFDGMALFNAFNNHPGGVTVRIEGLAASMASIVAMGGKKVEAYKNTTLMMPQGDHNLLREIANTTEAISGQMNDIYTGKTKSGKKEMQQMMDDETYMTAEQARKKGFIDSIIDGKGVKAEFDLSIFANCPDDLRGARDHELTERDAEKALRDAGFSRNKAKALLAGGKDSEGAEIEAVAALIKKNTELLGG